LSGSCSKRVGCFCNLPVLLSSEEYQDESSYIVLRNAICLRASFDRLKGAYEPLSVTFENPATEPKIRISFYLPKRTVLVNYFQN